MRNLYGCPVGLPILLDSVERVEGRLDAAEDVRGGREKLPRILKVIPALTMMAAMMAILAPLSSLTLNVACRRPRLAPRPAVSATPPGGATGSGCKAGVGEGDDGVHVCLWNERL
eukprot:GHVU01216476.1.p5 GENE.GHVU01216476.1~~GHVU01216476.1.p5  ORF type:complete len:115 (+),score=15.02 GHVU01216476.1:871-1215(+)